MSDLARILAAPDPPAAALAEAVLRHDGRIFQKQRRRIAALLRAEAERRDPGLAAPVEAAFLRSCTIHPALLALLLPPAAGAFLPEADGRPVANRVEPGKRPRSSMAPTLVFDAEGRLLAVLGSPGGARIIHYVARALVALLDWGMEPEAAAALPHVGTIGTALDLEEGTREPDGVRGEVRFDHVGFAYEPGGTRILDDIDLVVAPGTTLTGRVERLMDEPTRESVAALAPLGRLGTPEDIARLGATLVAEAVLVADRPGADIGDDFHVSMGVRGKAGMRGDAIVVPDPCQAKGTFCARWRWRTCDD